MPSAAARKGRHGASYRKHVDADPTWLGRCCLPYTPLPSRRNYDPGASGPPRGLWPRPPEPGAAPRALCEEPETEEGRPEALRRGGGRREHTGAHRRNRTGARPSADPGREGRATRLPESLCRVQQKREREAAWGPRPGTGDTDSCPSRRMVGGREENGACGVGGNSPRTRFQFGGGIFLGGGWRVHSREMVKAHEPSTEKWLRRSILRYMYLTIKSDQKTQP